MAFDHPLVSVVIPAYNCAPFIGETLESVYKQTYKNWEIILVDDGSTDDTRLALAGHMDRIRYFSQENKGTAAARNAGLQRARGELVAFLDNDDLWLPEKLEMQVEAIQTYPDVAIVFTDGKSFDESGTIKESLIPDYFMAWVNQHSRDDGIFLKGWTQPDLLNGNFISSATAVLVRRNCLKDVGGFDERISITDDYDLYFRLSRLYPFCLVRRPLYMWRYREDSQSGPTEKRYFRWSRAKIQVLEKYLPTMSCEDERAVKAKLAEMYFDCGWFYFSHNLFKNARKMLLGCLRYDKGSIKAIFYLLATYLGPSVINKLRILKRKVISFQVRFEALKTKKSQRS